MKVLRFLRNFFLKLFLAFCVLTFLLTLALRWINPPTSAFMLQAQIAPENYRWTPWDKISSTIRIAAVAAEDQNFPTHWGFDLDAIDQALKEHKRSGKLRGASTISQQVAKNLFLWPERSFFRKGLEAYFTLILEGLWPKKRVLEVYLNVAQFGPGVFGVDSAARYFFSTTPSRLTLRQSALLAAMLPRPVHRANQIPNTEVNRRAAHIERQVNSLGGTAYLTNL